MEEKNYLQVIARDHQERVFEKDSSKPTSLLSMLKTPEAGKKEQRLDLRNYTYLKIVETK